MKLKLLAVAALVALTATGCGEDKLDGRVSGKDVDPGYSYYQQIPITSCTSSSCTTTYIPMYYVVDTCYKLNVKGTVSGDTCVSKDTWEKMDVGDRYVGPDAAARKKGTEKH